MPPFVEIDYTRPIVVDNDDSKKKKDDNDDEEVDDDDDDESYGPLDVSPDDMLLLREWLID